MDAGEIAGDKLMPPYNQVHYIIFEMADNDLRDKFINVHNPSWKELFKSLHNVAVGIRQLHNAGIAHQDIKPSNILCFGNDVSKVSDLGRVTDSTGESPFLVMNYTGDFNYAPPEIIFEVPNSDFVDRRASDLYMLGSLIYHLVMGVQITGSLFEETRLIYPNLSLSDYEEKLPFFQTAFVTILERMHRHLTEQLGEKVANEVREVVKELCEPNYKIRGNNKFKQKSRRLSVERYVSKLATVVRLTHFQGALNG